MTGETLPARSPSRNGMSLLRTAQLQAVTRESASDSAPGAAGNSSTSRSLSRHLPPPKANGSAGEGVTEATTGAFPRGARTELSGELCPFSRPGQSTVRARPVAPGPSRGTRPRTAPGRVPSGTFPPQRRTRQPASRARPGKLGTRRFAIYGHGRKYLRHGVGS